MFLRGWFRAAYRCSQVETVQRSSIMLRSATEVWSTDIPRKPNYDFERREREKAKTADAAKKAQAKADKRAGGQVAADPDQSGDAQDQ